MDKINVEIIVYYNDPEKERDIIIKEMEVGCMKPYLDIEGDIKSISIRPLPCTQE